MQWQQLLAISVFAGQKLLPSKRLALIIAFPFAFFIGRLITMSLLNDAKRLLFFCDS